MEKLYCPRLEHYVRLNSNGTFGQCGHMVDPPQFDTYKQMNNSVWAEYLKYQMNNNEWPDECKRCKATEEINGTSIRLNSIERDKILSKFKKDYIQLGGTLDNYCNSACISCNPGLSTRIGNLKGKLVVNDNYDLYKTLPLDQIVEIDINGGEPSISVNYNDLLDNIPENVKIIRINTNGCKRIKQLPALLARKIKIIITVSLDGLNQVHDYARYPVKWTDFSSNLQYYNQLSKEEKMLNLDTWTTVSVLNIQQLPLIQEYCKDYDISHEFALLEHPSVMNVRYSNWFTLQAQDVIPGKVAIDRDNTVELDAFLGLEEAVRPGIERFWT